MRRPLPWILLLAGLIHGIGIARTLVPAQDGLKYLRTARTFQNDGIAAAIRGSDQHPLYPALAALAEPPCRLVLGPGPDTWRIAAQGVSAFAAILTLVPLFGLVRSWFGDRIAALAAGMYALLPIPSAVGHDTLADPLALLGFMTALFFGDRALRDASWRSAAACGFAAGLGFLARPEALLMTPVVGLVLIAQAGWQRSLVSPALVRSVTALGLATALPVGLYVGIKGELSEKLAVRRAGAVQTVQPVRAASRGLPPGLDDPRWDFAPKEESRRTLQVGFLGALRLMGATWVESASGVVAVLTLVGIGACWRRVPVTSRALVVTFVLTFGTLLARNASALGYLSERHVLSLVLLSVPWAAAGGWALAERASRFRVGRRGVRLTLAAFIVLALVALQRPSHPSRWGHYQAGLWLTSHRAPEEAVLDTRGWAAFVAGGASYDPWHVGQALSDHRLAYIVVGADELEASSRRAATWRAVLDRAGTLAASFPARREGRGADVRIYRFHQPVSWERMAQ